MANIKSQKKRIITAEKARQRNRAVRSELKTAVKKVRLAVEAKDVDAAMVALFFLGMIFCFFVIQPAAFGWLLDQSFEIGAIMPNAEDYLDIYMLLEIGFGIAFQLPLVIFYLSVFHLVPYKTFRAQWRYVYVGLMVLSAVVTPDASPMTMILMFAALIGLYEVALAVARVIIVARDGKEALKWSREDYEQHAFDKQ